MNDPVRGLILPRKRDSNKGDYGHVLVIAGSRGMSGAACLAAAAALRSGAGLVTLAVPESLQPLVAASLNPSAMTLGLPEDGQGRLCRASLEPLADYAGCRRVTTLVAGPGLGTGDELVAMLCSLFRDLSFPVILDADGLALLQKGRHPAGDDVLRALAGRLVITPHPGEFSRITGLTVAEIQAGRAEKARAYAAAHGIVCVLKGSGTVVTDGKETVVNATGNPGMARGGSGDVLSGVIGALAAQVAEPRLYNAAVAGVYLHGLAGDIAAAEKTQYGMLPTDVIECLPAAFRRVTG